VAAGRARSPPDYNRWLRTLGGMSLRQARLTRAAIVVATVVLAAITIAGCSTTNPSFVVEPSNPSPSPSQPPTFDPSALCGDLSCQAIADFICAGGTDCKLNFRRDGCPKCKPATFDYRVTVMTDARSSEVISGQLVFAAGGNVATIRFRASARVVSTQLELSVRGVVVYRRTLVPAP